MTNEVKIEAKLGFDKLRGVSPPVVPPVMAGKGRRARLCPLRPAEIERRLGLADEMRVILMFETAFPNSGFGDCIPFWCRCAVLTHYIDLPSLIVLRGSLDALRRILAFFQRL